MAVCGCVVKRLVSLSVFVHFPNNRVRYCCTAAKAPKAKNRRMEKLQLTQVVAGLFNFAPKYLAADWDNVGLLLEPTSPHEVEKILLTNDLTEPVLEEAMTLQANMIYSYHPPLFDKFNRINGTSWKERIVVRCLENRIAVYSPHTTLDSLPDGLNDWLIRAFDVRNVKPIESCYNNKTTSGFTHTVRVNDLDDDANTDEIKKELGKLKRVAYNYNEVASELVIYCDEYTLPKISGVLSMCNPSVIKSTHVTKEELLPVPDAGFGRIGELNKKITVNEAVQLVKNHLGLEHVRLGIAYGSSSDSSINTVAVVGGSGGSFLPRIIGQCDLFITGEMKHHEALHAVSSGVNVILCEHSNSERGFLKNLAPRLKKLFKNKVEVIVSSVDKDPLMCT